MRRAIIFGYFVCGDPGAGVPVAGARWLNCEWQRARRDVYRGSLLLHGVAEAADTDAPKDAQPRLTLDPNQFVGPVKEAYKFAEKNPELFAQLHCYCGCDKAEGHQNLLDCYRSMHGASCEICTGEALLAKRMSDQGSPVDQIRNAIRRNFAQDN